MGKKKSSFHMGDEFNGNGQKVHLRPTQHRTYTPLSQQGVRLTSDFSQFVPKAIGAIPVGCKSANTESKTALKALGGIPSVSQVMIKKEKKTGTYKGEFRVRKKQLTTGGSLQEKRGWCPKIPLQIPNIIQRKPIKISKWLTAYEGEPTRGGRVAVLGKEELHYEDRERFRVDHPSADWYSYEDIWGEENGNAVRSINTYAVSQFDDNYQKLELRFSQEEGFTNEEGRYWVAVGPEVLSPGYNKRPKAEQTLNENHFKYGTKIDVVMSDMREENRLIYIECIVGDVMGHTYSNGVFQTGDPYPNSENAGEDGSYAINGAYIEFINAPKDENGGYINSTDDNSDCMSYYQVIEIILYERNWQRLK